MWNFPILLHVKKNCVCAQPPPPPSLPSSKLAFSKLASSVTKRYSNRNKKNLILIEKNYKKYFKLLSILKNFLSHRKIILSHKKKYYIYSIININKY